MNWFDKHDATRPVLTAAEHIKSFHGRHDGLVLPETAVLFYMYGGVEHFKENYGCRLIAEKLPRFLQGSAVYASDGGFCFMDGGRGAPQAVDTVETLAALGVKRVITVGMFGAFGEGVETGELICPDRAFIEEGTSLHYREVGDGDFSTPDEALACSLAELSGAKRLSIVSTDAVYRQTYRKEAYWRRLGAVGVDMETSAIFTVSGLLSLQAAALLMASDKHPLDQNAPKWEWKMTREMRLSIFERAARAASVIAQSGKKA